MTHPCLSCYKDSKKCDDCEDWKTYVREIDERVLETEVIK